MIQEARQALQGISMGWNRPADRIEETFVPGCKANADVDNKGRRRRSLGEEIFLLAEVGKRKTGGLPAPSGSLQIAGLDEIGLVDILQRRLFLVDGGGQRLHADRPAAEFLDDRRKDLA